MGELWNHVSLISLEKRPIHLIANGSLSLILFFFLSFFFSLLTERLAVDPRTL
jgi:hypothetical protein